MEKIKQIVKRIPLLAIPILIIAKIIPGFLLYRKFVKKYGSDVEILRTAWHGTGDYYICGMYLPEYIEQNRISNYIFLVSMTGSEKKVTELFDGYRDHVVEVRSVEALSRFSEFMQQKKPLCKSFECSDHLSFIGEQLKGYRGLSLMDFYIWYGFGFQTTPATHIPQFSKDPQWIDHIMSENMLREGKTVLLSPFSTCSQEFLPPDSFWEDIALYLQQCGYSVVTNCFGEEQAVRGTRALSIPYTELVPFLDRAGGFIGIRSGLCDILSQSTCKKIVIHPEKSNFWPAGKAEEFVGLKTMGLIQVGDEFFYFGNWKSISRNVLYSINNWNSHF